MRKIDLAGERIFRLLVLHQAVDTSRVAWVCQCDCGKQVIIDAAVLRQKRQKSCGCFRKEMMITHGRSYSHEYHSWHAMRERCENPRHQRYKDWGGRGVTVCERWHLFVNFFADMGEKPSPKHSIDRIDNNGNYEPGNCRWATSKEQIANRQR